MHPDICIIGGTRLEKHFSETSFDTTLKAFYRSRSKQIERQFPAKEIKINSRHILFVNRYRVGLSEGKSKYAAHEVDYKTIMAGLYQNGVKKVISINKSGSLQRETRPGTLALSTDFIDFVNRDLTFDDIGLEVADMAIPFDPGLCETIKKAAYSEKIKLPDAIYIVCVDGSRLETPAEINFLRASFSGNLVVGMEVPTEAELAKILNIKYAAICVITNYATGMRNRNITQSMIEGAFEKSMPIISKLLLKTISNL